MRKLTYLFIGLMFYSCSTLTKTKSDIDNIKVVKVNEGEGYIYFDIHFDTIPIVDLSKKISISDNVDTCKVKIYLSAYKNRRINKDSIQYACQNNSVIPDKIIEEFYSRFNPVMKGEIGIYYEPYNFYLPISFAIENKKPSKVNRTYQIGHSNKWQNR